MSSSSSLAAARRRRAGGANQPTGPSKVPPGRGPPPSQSTRQPNPGTPTPSIPPNPLMILQQHHAKINMLDEQIKLLLNNQEFSPPVPSSNPPSENVENENLEESTPTQQRFDLNEITDLLLSRIEQKLDLKVFYDNDQRLASEIEGLNKIILQQQSTLNNLNKLLYFLISNLKLELKEESLDIEDKSIIEQENINFVVGDHVDEDSMTTQTPTFPKSVKIDLEHNETTEFTSFDLDDDASNYEPGTEFSEDGLPIPPVD
jgi:hypothetical protein